jgi:diaminopimelate epimerase
MEIAFWKMHGAGNDFVLVDDRHGVFPERDSAWVRAVCARRTGVGCEGVILLSGAGGAEVRMRFLNPDGKAAEFCGNGARCAARLASDLGMAGREVTLRTDAGPVVALVGKDGVTLRLPSPRGWRLGESVRVAGADFVCHFVNTGVPHVVVPVGDPAKIEVESIGSAIRRHERYAPAGTNVNFVSVTGPRAMAIRTYERGVEAETGACGSGAVAAALVAARLGLAGLPVSLRTSLGHELVVCAEPAGEGFESVRLTGPAEYVFRGTVEYPEPAGGRQ